MHQVSNALLLVQVLTERWVRYVFTALLALIVLAAMTVGFFTLFWVIDSKIWHI